MPHPKHAIGEAPLPSPHPLFGRKPNWWTRLFGSERKKYWPTDGDFELYRTHMINLRKGIYPEDRFGNKQLPFSPELTNVIGEDQFSKRRRCVYEVKKYFSDLGKRPGRDWWE